MFHWCLVDFSGDWLHDHPFGGGWRCMEKRQPPSQDYRDSNKDQKKSTKVSCFSCADCLVNCTGGCFTNMSSSSFACG